MDEDDVTFEITGFEPHRGTKVVHVTWRRTGPEHTPEEGVTSTRVAFLSDSIGVPMEATDAEVLKAIRERKREYIIPWITSELVSTHTALLGKEHV